MELGKIDTNLSSIKKQLKKQQNRLLIKRAMSNRLMLTGSIIIIFIILFTFLAPFLVSYAPNEMEVSSRLQAPSKEHLLGTDNFGRDILSRIAYGARVSMGVGFSVTFLATVIGLIIGLYASYYKLLDHILMRICDGMMAIPAILLAIALMSAFGANIANVIIALTAVFTPYIARVVRSAALSIREQTYIEAMKSQGASSWRIILLHIMPNTISPVIIQSTFIFADTIIVEAALSFLGAGVPAPDPSWGNILSDSKLTIFTAWWMALSPGLIIIISILGLNLLGDGLRDFIDPHSNHIKRNRFFTRRRKE